MRMSVAALALFRRPAPDGRVEYLAQWNNAWHAFHLVGGHKNDGESFRDCCVREIAEELALVACRDFRVAAEPRCRLQYLRHSERAGVLTAYTLELFDAELVGDTAVATVAADPCNRWLTEDEIRAGRCRHDGRAVSPTLPLQLALAALLPEKPMPLVLWTVTARRRLRQALAEAIGRHQPDALEATMTDLSYRLERLFPGARAATVQDQYLGYRRRDNEFILETELKTRAYAALFAHERARDFIKEVQEFEVALAEETEACHNGKAWPRWEEADGGGASTPSDRLRRLLLALRQQAAQHLGGDRGRPRQWLDEYYFALVAYGITVGRFDNLDRPLWFAAYVPADVAAARFLYTREDQLNGDDAKEGQP